MKSEGGAIRLTEHQIAFSRWIVSGPEFSELISLYELASLAKVPNEDITHYGKTSLPQKSPEKVQILFDEMKDLGIPF